MFVNRLPELLRQAFSFHQYHHHDPTAPLSKKGFFMKQIREIGESLNMKHPCYIFIFSGYGDYQRHARKLIAADLQSSTGKEIK